MQLVAIGAYQVQQALLARERLTARGYSVCVTAIIEPARFRDPRDEMERGFVADHDRRLALFPRGLARVIVSHTRPEPMLGILRPIDGGPGVTRALGYRNRGGTLDVDGMLFANRCTWAHIVEAVCQLTGIALEHCLDAGEKAALDGVGAPRLLADHARA